MKKITHLVFLLLFCVAATATAQQKAKIGGGKHSLSYADFPLAQAIKKGDNKTVEELLAKDGPNAKQAGIPPLAVALQANNVEAAEMIITHPDFKNINEFYTVTIGGSTPQTETYTAIVDAIETFNPELIKLVLDKGADVDYLYETIEEGSPRMLVRQQTPLTNAMVTLGSYDARKRKNTQPYDIEAQYEQIQRIADGTKNIDRIITQHNSTSGVGPGNKPYAGGTVASQALSLFMLLTQYNNFAEDNPNNEYINKVLFSIADRVDLAYRYSTFSPELIKQMRQAGVSEANIKAAEAAAKYAYVCNTWIYTNAPLLDHVLTRGGTASLSVNNDGGKFFFVNTQNTESLDVLLKHGMDINAPAYNGFRLVYGAPKISLEFFEAVLERGADPTLTLPDGVTNAASFIQMLPARDKRKAEALIKKYSQN